MTLIEFKRSAVLKLNRLDHMASLEVDWIIQHVLGFTKSDIILNYHMELSEDKVNTLEQCISRRLNGEPLQYILGSEHFMGLDFKVCPSVLIPRFDTEILVNTAMDKIRKLSEQMLSEQTPSDKKLRILDIGTGSGAIPIVLAKLIQDLTADNKLSIDVEFTGVDISEDALIIARQNAMTHVVDDKIRFIKSDIFSVFSQREDKFDIIVSNPPYIPTADIESLQIELSFEPVLALDGGIDGYDFYKKIIKNAPKFLRSGYLIVETGHDQANNIANMMTKDFNEISIFEDMQSIPRVVCGKLS